MFKADVSQWANDALRVEITEVTHLNPSRGKTGLTQVVYGVSETLNDLLLQYGTQKEIHDGFLQLTGEALNGYADQLPRHNMPVEDVLVVVGMGITFNGLDVDIMAVTNSNERKGRDAGLTTFIGFILPDEMHHYIEERSPHTTLQ